MAAAMLGTAGALLCAADTGRSAREHGPEPPAGLLGAVDAGPSAIFR